MRYIILLMSLSLVVLNAKDYAVKLFDSNISQGVWQMVGTLGLKDVSVEGVTLSSSSDTKPSDDPVIPDEDISTINTVQGIKGVYNESGISKDEINIVKIFDVNISNNNFNKLNPQDGELSIYRYNGSGFEDVWSYYNSKNSLEGNDFIKIEKGRGYWAKYQNDVAVFETNNSYISNSGFIFNDAFKLGFETYVKKISDGWNLLSLPEKRTIENMYMVILDYDLTRDYNLSFARKDDMSKFKVNLSTNQMDQVVKTINQNLSELDIIAMQSNINSGNQVVFFSNKEFVVSEKIGMQTIGIPDTTNTLNLSGNQTTLSKSIYGLVVDINSSFISNFTSLEVDLNGEKVDLVSSNLVSSTKEINSLKLIGDHNLTLVFSKDIFYIENTNYVKTYEFNGSVRPTTFYSIDDNKTIFQITKDREDINTSFNITQNSSNHEIIRGYANIVDFILDASIDNAGVTTFPKLSQASHYIKTYPFPKTNNLKFFLNNVYDGYKATQILSLKNRPTSNGDWNSMPINNDLSSWNLFTSRYDRLFYIDKTKSYWVKFSESASKDLGFTIDKGETPITRNITHQLSDDNKTITNIVHYNIQIFLKNATKSIRGYVKIDNLEIDLKSELDGSLLTAEIDYESLYKIKNLNKISKVTAFVIDENGIEKSVVLDINFTKPNKPSKSIKLVDIIDNKFFRIYQDSLDKARSVETLYPELCQDLGVSNIYVTKVDLGDISLNANKLIFSDPVKIVYASMYKGTSKLSSDTSLSVEKPIKYDSNCAKVSAETVKTEGVTIGISTEQIYLFYKKSSEFSSDNLSAPKVMYVKINDAKVQIEFDASYEKNEFYILDKNENVFKGQFISDNFDDDSTPYILQQIR